MKEFILKSIVFNVCLIVLFKFCIPKYEFVDGHTRCNKITGSVEHYGNLRWNSR